MTVKRREFIQNSAAATLAMLFSSMENFASGPIVGAEANGFQLLIMATNWGFSGSIEEFCAAARKEGYDGIEIWWPGEDEAAVKDLFEALKKHDLAVGFLCAGSQSNPSEHLAAFKKNVDAATGNKFQKPVYINCHSGKDYFSFNENQLFINYTIQRSEQTSIPIYHETHRGRMLFAAHIARQFMDKNPSLKLTFDVSHWCNVHESMLADQPGTMALALDRTEHIHARIGHPEGPQVNDPRAPEWEKIVAQHLTWWDAVIARKKKNGERMTILTEFGPPDYMPTMPYTRQPLSDQWAVNVHMMQLLRKRYC
jgi:sugar phosphate isomerase/epimerase